MEAGLDLEEKDSILPRSRTARFTAFLALTETGLGSALHAFQVPLAGHLLALNQSLVLTWNAQALPYREALQGTLLVSAKSSVLKSLSPAGKKLTPMLAILMQGILFSFGIVGLGANAAGFAVGAALASIWGFAQPLLIAYFLFGGAFFDSLLKESAKLGQVFSLSEGWLPAAIAIAIVVKAALAIGLSVFAVRASASQREAYLRKMQSYAERFAKPRPASESNSQCLGRRLLRELRSPLLFVSFALSLAFFCLQDEHGIRAVWNFVLRPVAILIVFALVMQSPLVARWMGRIADPKHLG